MIEFLIKTYLAFVVIDTVLALLYHQLMKRKLESKEIDEIIQEQVKTEDELRDEIRSIGKTQEEVDKTLDWSCITVPKYIFTKESIDKWFKYDIIINERELII